jgi:DME family drug/metabolite transporter
MTPSHIMIAAAATLWSLSGMFTKSISLPGPTIACYRVIFAGLALLPLVNWRRVRWRPALVGMVACFALMNVTFISAMTFTTAANAILLQSTAPLWVLIAGVLWLKEPVDRKGVVSLALSLVGIAIILIGEGAGLNVGAALALIAGVAYAGVIVNLRHLRDEDPFFITMLNMLGSGLILGAALALWPSPEGTGALLQIETSHVLPLAAFGVIQMALPYWLFSRGVRGVSAQEAGIIVLIEPILNPLVTYWTVGEVPAVATMIGGGVILASVVMRLVGASRTT